MMNSFFDRMRSGAGKAAFEADKLRRIALLQNELRGLRDDFHKALGQTGQMAFDLYQRGQVTQPELRAACDVAAAVMAAINAREADVERTRNEQFIDPQLAAAPLLACPMGHGPLPLGARFCQLCGQPGIDAPPSPPPPAFCCPTCGEDVAADTLFCANCGQQFGPPAAPPAPPAALGSASPPAIPATLRLGAVQPPAPETAAHCPSCGAKPDRAEAVFCNVCGYRLQHPA